jgi:hypothetical protein
MYPVSDKKSSDRRDWGANALSGFYFLIYSMFMSLCHFERAERGEIFQKVNERFLAQFTPSIPEGLEMTSERLLVK